MVGLRPLPLDSGRGWVLESPLTPGLTRPSIWGQRLRLTESDKLQVQIQAYLDNVFDVGALLEDTETKNAVLEHMEELQEQVTLVRAAPEPTSLGPTMASGRASHWGTALCLAPAFDLNPNPESSECLPQ